MKSQENQIELSVENGVGIITLNRAEAINALTPYMIETIRKALLGWRSDQAVRAVLLEGKGERGFCAGGDVRWTRQMVLEGQQEKAFEFFALEYDMNRIISTYEKPLIALTHGVVMGGGIGLAGHARYRIADIKARFAMPEAAIGYYCDVGVRSLLAAVVRHRALSFMLAGTLVSASDAIELNLNDVAIMTPDFPLVREALIEAGSADDINQQIKRIMADFSAGDMDTQFCTLIDEYAEIFSGVDCATIYEKLEKEVAQASSLGEMAGIILSRCPTSNQVHVGGVDAARRAPDITVVLKADLKLAHFMAVRDDFVEGVRAVLIDKDHTPIWKPAHIRDVDGKAIERALA